jgi:hypothetical protein
MVFNTDIILKGAKEINAAMFVRLGLANAKTVGFLQHNKFGVNWYLKDNKDLKQWYKKIITYIHTEKYGVYFALEEVFDAETADRVAAKGHVIKPHGMRRPTRSLEQPEAGPSRKKARYSGNDDDYN